MAAAIPNTTCCAGIVLDLALAVTSALEWSLAQVLHRYGERCAMGTRKELMAQANAGHQVPSPHDATFQLSAHTHHRLGLSGICSALTT